MGRERGEVGMDQIRWGREGGGMDQVGRGGHGSVGEGGHGSSVWGGGGSQLRIIATTKQLQLQCDL